ncbi:hypothetical protein MKX03_026718, partial [Papaver bracteatum]
NPVTLQVHPPNVTSAYLNSLHDVHQLRGNFSDDDDNDYYPEVDDTDAFVPPSPDVIIDAAFAPTDFDSSLESSIPLKGHVVDSCIAINKSNTDAPCQATQSSSEICTTSVVDEPMVVVAAHVADATGSERVFQPNPYPYEVDVIVISSSVDKA